MATITARVIVNSAAVLLQDTTFTRWSLNDLLGYTNDGQRRVCLLKPNAFVKNTNVSLASGAKQTLPSDASGLIDITRNVGGPAIRVIARSMLDALSPNWTLSDNARDDVVHYCYSELDPKNFYVYPPSPGGKSVEMIYAAIPPNATIDQVLSIDDLYDSALVDYVMFRAYSRDVDLAAPGSADKYYQSFLAAVTGKLGGEMATDPNAKGAGTPVRRA